MSCNYSYNFKPLHARVQGGGRHHSSIRKCRLGFRIEACNLCKNEENGCLSHCPSACCSPLSGCPPGSPACPLGDPEQACLRNGWPHHCLLALPGPGPGLTHFTECQGSRHTRSLAIPLPLKNHLFQPLLYETWSSFAPETVAPEASAAA